MELCQTVKSGKGSAVFQEQGFQTSFSARGGVPIVYRLRMVVAERGAGSMDGHRNGRFARKGHPCILHRMRHCICFERWHFLQSIQMTRRSPAVLRGGWRRGEMRDRILPWRGVSERRGAGRGKALAVQEIRRRVSRHHGQPTAGAAFAGG